MKTKDFLDINASIIICKMADDFDSHDFIKQLLKDYESDYVELLYLYKDSVGIFQTFHSVIAKYLSDNATLLKISKSDKCKSMNIKDYESLNQMWRKEK